MKRVYELWLDESGKFSNESSLKGTKFFGSLIGGILIEKDKIAQLDFDELLSANINHAMEMEITQKKDYILPILEKVQEAGGKQVFFENTAYEDDVNSRQLYLRMMAEGLLQLMQTLNAMQESVCLEVMIAQRQDVGAPVERRRIEEEEYLAALKRCIAAKKRGHQIFLHENSEIQFVVRAAHSEQKLQLADFACNTRLTRNSNIFVSCKSRVESLHKDAYLFELSEVGSVNYIKRCLVQYNIADAFMELYLSRDKAQHEEMLDLIMKRIDRTNYRLMKSQLKQYASKIVAYAAKQEDYEVGEQILLRVHEELIPLLREKKQPYHHLHITSLLQLADMYLREGNLLSAEKILIECEEIHKVLGNQLEDFLLWYQILEKKSLLYINSFDYARATALLEEVCEAFEAILKVLGVSDLVKKRFKDVNSEYYGDALCIRIYAMMFMQRENPTIYEKLCKLSDIALQQYPDHEEELERHRQYRSHIELEQGEIEKSVRWLLMAKCYHPEQIGQTELEEFLNRICYNDDEIGRQYYMMYYLLIMCEAKIKEHPLADIMFQALRMQEYLKRDLGLIRSAEEEDYEHVLLNAVKEMDTGNSYHPMEVVYWKYATYLMKCKREYAAGLYYKKAIDICFKYSEYDTIQITGLGIMAEYCCCRYQAGDKKGAKLIYEQLKKRIEELQKKKLPEVTEKFVGKLETLTKMADKGNGKIDTAVLWDLSRKITY